MDKNHYFKPFLIIIIVFFSVIIGSVSTIFILSPKPQLTISTVGITREVEPGLSNSTSIQYSKTNFLLNIGLTMVFNEKTTLNWNGFNNCSFDINIFGNQNLPNLLPIHNCPSPTSKVYNKGDYNFFIIKSVELALNRQISSTLNFSINVFLKNSPFPRISSNNFEITFFNSNESIFITEMNLYNVSYENSVFYYVDFNVTYFSITNFSVTGDGGLPLYLEVIQPFNWTVDTTRNHHIVTTQINQGINKFKMRYYSIFIPYQVLYSPDGSFVFTNSTFPSMISFNVLFYQNMKTISNTYNFVLNKFNLNHLNQ